MALDDRGTTSNSSVGSETTEGDQHSLEGIDGASSILLSAEVPAAPDDVPPGYLPVRQFVYALGKIEPRFPSIAVEKEFAQAASRLESEGLSDQAAFTALLREPSNRYIVRQLCWTMTVGGLETYIIYPRDPADYSLFLDTLTPEPDLWAMDLVIGVLGPIASPDVCNGAMLPIVAVDHVYSFTRQELIEAIPTPDAIPSKERSKFEASAAGLFDRLIRLADNAGSSDEDRALNYLAVRYPGIYWRVAERNAEGFSLISVRTQFSPVSVTRRIVNVIVRFQSRTGSIIDEYCAEVDVTEEFPFLQRGLSPYVSRF